MSNVTRTAPQNLSIKNTFVNASSLGATQIIAGQPGMSIRVISVAIVTTLANSVKFLSSATDISATFPLGATGGLVCSFNEHGWFQTAVGEALSVNLSVATVTGVQINYIIL